MKRERDPAVPRVCDLTHQPPALNPSQMSPLRASTEAEPTLTPPPSSGLATAARWMIHLSVSHPTPPFLVPISLISSQVGAGGGAVGGCVTPFCAPTPALCSLAPAFHLFPVSVH